MKCLLLLPLWALTCRSVHAQVAYQYYYGASGTEYARTVEPTSDGGYILAGNERPIDVSHPRPWLLRLSEDGTVTWSRSYTIDIDGSFTNAVQTADGGFVAVGTAFSAVSFQYDPVLVRLDAQGGLLWERSFRGLSSGGVQDVAETADGGFVLCGQIEEPVTEKYQLFVARTDAEGTVLFSRRYFLNDSTNTYGFEVLPTADDGILAAGFCSVSSFGTGARRALLLKMDASGYVQWAKGSPAAGGNSAGITDLLPLNGGYALSGKVWDGDHDDLWLAVVNTQGTLQWNMGYHASGGLDHQGFGLCATPNGGFALCGTMLKPDADMDLLLVKTNNLGAVQWAKSYGSPSAAYATAPDVVRNTDDGFTLVGTSDGFEGGMNGYVVRTDAVGASGCNETNRNVVATAWATAWVDLVPDTASGMSPETPEGTSVPFGQGHMLCSTVGMETPQRAQGFTVAPNPATDFLVVQGPVRGAATIELLDVTGRVVLAQRLVPSEAIKVAQLCAGDYTVRLRNAAGSPVGFSSFAKQ